MSHSTPRESGFGLFLRRLCDLSAAFGGLVLLGMSGITIVSVFGRFLLSSPILGDVELVQIGVAVCVSCFLPYTQFRGSNIIVDFFTQKTSERTRQRLDGLGTALYAVVLALICWRVLVGGMSAYETGEASTLMNLPIWIPYFAMVPGLGLAALVGTWQTASRLGGASDRQENQA